MSEAPLPARVSLPHEGRRRVAIENISPVVDGGRFAVKRVLGERLRVELDAFADGHDRIGAVLRYRHEDQPHWREVALAPLGNDRWGGEFPLDRLGGYRFAAAAWVDDFATWQHDLARRPATDPDLALVYRTGAQLIDGARGRAPAAAAARLAQTAAVLGSDRAPADKRAAALDPELGRLMAEHAERRFVTETERDYPVTVERVLAASGAWYEFFPRSCGDDGHGRFADCESRLAYAAAMGFDIVYLPPIHPIGSGFRKGPNNTLNAGPDDPGSPWAIGSRDGGHTAVHPELGTLEDFRRFVARAAHHGLEVALDLAFQCSPDHPYLQRHPQWFRRRPDGSIQYAENPPKKYQDIYPFDFETDAWPELWQELQAVVRFWIAEGVTIFRVDNPHTKAFAFWEWLIGSIRHEHPETIFLSEAFTRPRVMHRLAKLGFSQSYTYFTWRNTRHELVDYFTELARGPGREYFRPNLWPNTPDILSEYLQFGGRPAFMIRLVLAATLAGSYGIYGPAFELAEAEPREPGSEEYRDSEKYQRRHWDIDRPDSLREFIARVNRIRREHPALRHDGNLEFHPIDNDQLIAYSRAAGSKADDIVVVVVNLDPHHRQAGWLELPIARLGIDAARPYQVHDLLGGARYLWHGARNLVELDPAVTPAHVFRLRRRVHREHDFDYYL